MRLKQGYQFSTRWTNLSNIKLSKGNNEYGVDSSAFAKTNKTLTCAYDPFAFFYNPIPEDVVTDILGMDRETTPNNVRIHTLFASLDPENDLQLLKCAEHLGFPTYWIEDGHTYMTEEIHSPDYETWDVIQFLGKVKDDIYLLRLVISALTNLTESLLRDRRYLRKSLEALNRTSANCVDTELTVGTDFLQLPINVMEAVEDYVDEQVSQVSPCYRKGEIYWRFDTLQSALIFMVLMDVSKHVPPKFCARKACNNVFTPSRDSQIYCSSDCQKTESNTSYMKRTRKKTRQEKELEGNYKGPGRPKKGV